MSLELCAGKAGTKSQELGIVKGLSQIVKHTLSPQDLLKVVSKLHRVDAAGRAKMLGCLHEEHATSCGIGELVAKRTRIEEGDVTLEARLKRQ